MMDVMQWEKNNTTPICCPPAPFGSIRVWNSSPTHDAGIRSLGITPAPEKINDPLRTNHGPLMTLQTETRVGKPGQ